MKKYYISLILSVIILLGVNFGQVYSLSVFQYIQGGTGTTTAPIGQLLYGGSTAYQSVATTSVTCSGSTSCTAFTAIGNAPITISSSASAGGSGNVSTSTNETVGQLSYWTTTSATPALLGKVATSTLSFSSPLSGTSVSIVGTNGGAITCPTCAVTGTTITVNGTTNQITSSAGAQDLSANRTWTLSFPNQVIFPQYASTTNGFSTPYASSTSLFAGTLTLPSIQTCNTTSALTTTAGVVGCGSITGSGGGIADPFTHTSVWGQTTSATSTLLALTGSPYSLVASSTAVLTYASTTALSVSNLTSGRVPFITTGGMLTDSAEFTFGSSALVVGSTNAGTLRLDNGDTGTGVTLQTTGAPGSVTITFPMTTGTVCLLTTCPGAFPFTVNTGYNSTTSTIGFITGGLFSTASSTFSSSLFLSSLTQGNLYTGTNGLVQTAATSSETCTSPLSCTGFDVLKNGGAITLGTVTVAKGGTNQTSYPINSIITSDSAGTSLIATGTQLTIGNILATTTAVNQFNGVLVAPDGTLSNPAFSFSDDQNNGIYSPANDIFAILTNGVERFRINDSSGYSSFGTTTEGLSILTLGTSTAPQLTLSSNTGGVAGWAFRNAGGNLYLGTTTVAGTATSSLASLTLCNTTTPGIFNLGTTTNCGVNAKTTPGSATIATTSTAQLTLQGEQGLPPVNFRAVGGSFYIATSSATSQATSTRATLGFNSSGQILLGNYADCSDATHALGVSGNLIVCDASISDIRFKKDVKPLTSGLTTILALKPILFSWKDLTNHNTSDPRVQEGFSAQDVQKVIPDAVIVGSDGVLTLDKTKIIPYLVDAIKSMWKNITDLIAWNKDQDTSLQKLEKQNADQQKQIDELRAEIEKLKK